MRNARANRAGAPPFSPVLKELHEKPLNGLCAAKPFRAPASEWLKFLRRAVLCDRHFARSCASFPRHCLSRAVAVLHRRAGLGRDQWRWPAWLNGRRVYPREYGAFPRGQIHRPACWPIFLRARPDARVRSFFVQACQILTFSNVVGCPGHFASAHCSRRRWQAPSHWHVRRRAIAPRPPASVRGRGPAAVRVRQKFHTRERRSVRELELSLSQLFV